ncbi:Bax inhibitor-1/YccA family protein [Paracrocinitomix mangrovi]|uniref:Bax inhibitor-1/YccA family protein n=1 Tax=Paracrocinitomix mangrovi TaxID=2862509 RepID=UPI001C8D1B58|nr:Bax inhibitor-1/YccA family protein [Paracrocinitomix mangrovi]UKN01131.1 Bax inhibitor-1/YccA family protein [Paracrocinitomix mangrovi]
MSYDSYEIIDSEVNVAENTRTFFASVYKYMFLALSITGVLAFITAKTGFLVDILTVSPYMFYVIAFAPLAVVLYLQFRIDKISLGAAIAMYLLYSVLLGISLSFIFMVYSMGSIAVTFFITAGAFGAMALIGYTTKTDLSKMGSLLYMLFIGMFIASIANWIIGSPMISWVVSFLGLFVFTGLTAWEMQRLKRVAMNPAVTGEVRQKQELIGGLTLYILFINLFLSILRFVGDR